MNKTGFTIVSTLPFLMLIYGCQPDAPVPASNPAVSVVPSPAVSQVAAVTQPKQAAVAVTGSKERELAQKSGCFACHTIEKKLVGPAWSDISAKYRGQKDAEAKLIVKVAKGGSGSWGSVPMPPNAPKVADSDIKALVRFILSLN